MFVPDGIVARVCAGLGVGGQMPSEKLWLCDTTKTEPVGLRAAHGDHESSDDGEPAMYRALSQGL